MAAIARHRAVTARAERLPVPAQLIERRIYFIRGQKVMFDADLAGLYRVETKALNRAVKRNPARFPGDFMFQLTADEADSLRCQSGTSNDQSRRPPLFALRLHRARGGDALVGAQ